MIRSSPSRARVATGADELGLGGCLPFPHAARRTTAKMAAPRIGATPDYRPGDDRERGARWLLPAGYLLLAHEDCLDRRFAGRHDLDDLNRHFLPVVR